MPTTKEFEKFQIGEVVLLGNFVCFYIILFHIFISVSVSMNPITMNRIKEILEQKGIKQTWLADKLGRSFSIVNAYVCNRRQPSLELLFEIAKILQVDPKELIDSKKNK